MDNFGLSDRLCDMDESDLTRDFMPDLNNMLQQEMEMVCQDFENEEDSCEKSFNADTLNLVSCICLSGSRAFRIEPPWHHYYSNVNVCCRPKCCYV